MASMRQKVLENRRKQYLFVLAHRRRIRDEIRPYLKEKRRTWWAAASGHKLRIRKEWISQREKARDHLRKQRLKHRATILQHKERIRREMAGR